MKKNGISYGLLTFAVLSLMYDFYCWTMRSSVGVLRSIDKLTCIVSGIVCIGIISIIIIRKLKHRGE